MKKVLLLLVCLFTLQTVVWADDDKPIQVNQLPQTAQTFIKTHFPDNKVAMAKMETDWFDKSYDVIFTNGDKLEFDKKGIWTEVNCKYSAVPVAVVPDAIKKYVATNYPDAKMLKIERTNAYPEGSLPHHFPDGCRAGLPFYHSREPEADRWEPDPGRSLFPFRTGG